MRKIIKMLQSMQQELEREGAAEADLFEKAMCACSGGEKDLTQTITEATAEIEEKNIKGQRGQSGEGSTASRGD